MWIDNMVDLSIWAWAVYTLDPGINLGKSGGSMRPASCNYLGKEVYRKVLRSSQEGWEDRVYGK